MRFLLAAGGTGGHVIPALVVARELIARNPGSQALFVGTAKGVENRLVPQAGFPLELVEVKAWQGQSLIVRARNLCGAPRALWQAFRIVLKFRPSVVLGVGGYASGPIMLAAGLSGIPLAVLEPNAYPGMANRLVAPWVARALLGFEQTATFFRPGRSAVVGIPVRKEFFEIEPKRHSPPFTILIFGGSQGARSLNRAAVAALPNLKRLCEKNGEILGNYLRIVHQTGQSEYNAMREEYVRQNVDADVSPYIEDMRGIFARADLVICRAGANTVAELAAAGKAAILVPFPAAANQHQLRNAEALANVGAARLILDKDLNGETFSSAVEELLRSPEALEQMETHIRPLARRDATQLIAEELERLARKK
jgi:UDP-N-acetylglucosamine--N-acetylmuramyl-(pentapeptide) pyrophosphoryl-undecaprenol N-acetylglucosamine transferase